MSQFNLVTYDVRTPKGLEEIVGRAEAMYEDAVRIAAGGMDVARDFASQRKDATDPFTDWTAERFSRIAADALACARAIVARGEAWWVHDSGNGQQTLVVVSLAADASAGPVGYMPLADVRTDAEGAITHYAVSYGIGGAAWARVEGTASFRTACQICCLSQEEAATLFDTRIDTIKSWWAGRGNPPEGVWAQLAQVYAGIAAAAAASAPGLKLENVDARLFNRLDGLDPQHALPGPTGRAAGAAALLLAIAARQPARRADG